MTTRTATGRVGTVLTVVLAVIACAIVSATTAAVSAGTDEVAIVLRNGDRIRGDQLSLTWEETSVLSRAARTLKFPTATIAQLDTFVPYAVRVASGEKLEGRLRLRTTPSGRFLHVAAPKPRTVPVSDVVSISPAYVHQDSEKEKQGENDAPASSSKGTDESQPTSTAESVATVGKPLEDDDDIHRLFQRQRSVLLRRGEMELDAGVSYRYSRSFDSSQNQLIYSRYSVATLAWAFGLSSFMQGAVSAPLVFHEEDRYEQDGRSHSERDAAAGNVVGALAMQVLHEDGPCPDVVLLADLSVPPQLSSANTSSQTGRVYSGFWSTDVAVSFVKSADPMTIFGRVGYSHPFERTIDGHRVLLGDFWGYTVGLGFAVNGKVSLSTSFQGGWQAPLYQDGALVTGTEAEPMSLRMGFVYAASRSWFVSPSVQLPLNSDGGVVLLSLPVAYRF